MRNLADLGFCNKSGLEGYTVHEGENVSETLMIGYEDNGAFFREVLCSVSVYGPVPLIKYPLGPSVKSFFDKGLFSFCISLLSHHIYLFGISVGPENIACQIEKIWNVSYYFHETIITYSARGIYKK